MATFTNTKKTRNPVPNATIVFHPILLGSVLAAVALVVLIGELPVNHMDLDKLYILLTIVSALMLLMLFVISRNISTRIKSEVNLHAILEHTDVSIYSLDTNYRYVAFNRTQSDHLKLAYGLEIKPGDHVFEFLKKLDPGEAEVWKNIYSKALKGETLKFEKEFMIHEQKRYISFSIYPMWRNSTVIGVSCFAQDITEQKMKDALKKLMTADLVQRNKDLEQFSYIVSHNLRGPVANILGLSNVIQTIALSETEKEKTRNYLFDAVKQLDVVIQDLNLTLDIKRNIHETKEHIIFSEAVNGVRSGMEACIEKRRAVIITNFEAAKGMYAIKSYIHSIFYNLISNSLKYAQPGVPPVIIIKSEIKNNKLCLLFSDNGLGIDLELCQDKIFGLYHRFHSEIDGKGLGLFMVKTQVEAMDGKIGLYSKVNQGTEFRIEFPLSQPALLEQHHLKIA